MKAVAAAVLAAFLVSPAGASPVCWVIEPSQSRLHFTGMQGDTPVTGVFRRFSGNFLVADAAQDHRLWVTVLLDSVDTRLPELNAILRGPLFFHTRRWPQAGFISRSISQSVEQTGEQRYRAIGDLTLRDVTRTVEFAFQFETRSADARLSGEGSLQRLDYGVGRGEWRNTDWVANGVTVDADLHLRRAEPGACASPENLPEGERHRDKNAYNAAPRARSSAG